MAVTCKYCSGPHPWYDCRKRPVDWKPGDAPMKVSASAEVAEPKMPARIAPKSKGGRPRIHPDRKAYKAQKERERRARLKEANK